MRNSLLFFILVFLTSCGSADAATIPTWWGILQSILGQFPEANAWLIVILPATMSILRLVSLILSFIADKTATDEDNKALETISNLIRWLAIVMSWFGIGNKEVVRKK